MEAAQAVFTEKGYDEALISEIAERAGVVEGSIYRYFDNKRDLLAKVVEHWYHQMLSDDHEKLKCIRGTWNRLRFMIWRHLMTIHNEPALCRLVFHELRSGSDYHNTTVNFAINRRGDERCCDQPAIDPWKTCRVTIKAAERTQDRRQKL